TNAPTPGIWTITTPTVWSDGTTDTANSGWATGDAAFFDGPDGVYGIQVGGAISMQRARFTASGYSLTNNAAGTLSGPRTPLFIVDGGRIGTVGTNVTVTAGLSVSMGADAGGNPAGTLVIDSGATVQQTGNFGMTLNGSGTVVSVKTSGTLKTSTG